MCKAVRGRDKALISTGNTPRPKPTQRLILTQSRVSSHDFGILQKMSLDKPRNVSLVRWPRLLNQCTNSLFEIFNSDSEKEKGASPFQQILPAKPAKKHCHSADRLNQEFLPLSMFNST
jgi:hypothetical protein